MRASGIIRGYVVHGMTARTAFGVETGVTLADSGGATLVTPRAAKIQFPGEHDKVTLVGLGQVRGGEVRHADVTVGIISGLSEDDDCDTGGSTIYLGVEAMQALSVMVDPLNKVLRPVVKENVTAFALDENKVKAAVTKFLRDQKIEEL